ncbi:MAG: hypothetical protein J6Q54_03050 [Oscillospiraceae bacterium]|nr:hypothetical protein [Oscillospiraceae bacterium]
MKKLWVILLAALLLCGCGKDKALETVSDISAEPVVARVQQIRVNVPPELSTPAMQSADGGKLYLCDDYSVLVQTLPSGNLAQTIYTVTGQVQENLQIQTTQQGKTKRYQFVWATTGEQGARVGRTCILDDGAYHYVLTALADETAAEALQTTWQEMFTSFSLTPDKETVSTGS